MSPTQLERWAKTRTRGKERFVRVHGVYGWGGWMFCFLFFTSVMDNHSKHHSLTETIIVSLVICVIICPISGYIWGAWTWSMAEKQFQTSSKASQFPPLPDPQQPPIEPYEY